MSCKQNLATTSPIFSTNLYQPPHLKNVFEGLVWDGFKSCRIQGECHLKIICVHITLNSFLYEFFPIRVFSYNVFNETMLTWAYVLSLSFPTGVFLEITKGHKILLKLLEIMVEYCFKSLFFPQGFGRCNSIDLKACIRSRGSVRNEKGVNSPVQTKRGPKTVPASWRTVKPHDHHGDVVVCLMSVLWIASRYSGYKLFLA